MRLHLSLYQAFRHVTQFPLIDGFLRVDPYPYS